MADSSDPLSRLSHRLAEIEQSGATPAEKVRRLVDLAWALNDVWKQFDEAYQSRLHSTRENLKKSNEVLQETLDKALNRASRQSEEDQRQLAACRDRAIEFLNSKWAALNGGYWLAVQIAVVLVAVIGFGFAVVANQRGFAYGFTSAGLFITGLGLQLLKYSSLADQRKTIEASIASVGAEWEANKKAREAALASESEQLEQECETGRRRNDGEYERYQVAEQAAVKTLFGRCSHLVQQIETASVQLVATLGCGAAPWESDMWSKATRFSVAQGGIRFGAFDVIATKFALQIPALMAFGKGKSLLFKVQSAEQSADAVNAAQSIITRILASIAPGKVQFTFIDPIGLGQNVAGFLALADDDPKLITHQAWTEARQIEQRLTDLTIHMATVLQKRLRQQYQDIDDYNSKAGELQEPYRVVVVVNFPEQFNDSSARQLQRIVQNGPRCGVYAIVISNTTKPLPHGVKLEELESHCDVVDANSVLRDPLVARSNLRLDLQPPKDLVAQVVDTVGKTAPRGIEIPFRTLLEMSDISSEKIWADNSVEQLRIPIGQLGDRKVQYLTLGGSGTAHHALVVGRPGSGKSNLMHVIITAAARKYGPDELLLYLVDFKQGVEFRTYAESKLPHAKVIAIQSEREFGLSVLQGIDEEMRRRGDVFKKSGGATDITSIIDFRKATNQHCPRILLLVDEFQEFFTQDDQIGRQASLLLDRLVRQGRAFGIHIMLGSQTLAGSYSLARSTLDQMAIRIALQCSEADSRLVLADDNPAARQLTHAGEGVYNASNGLQEGNNFFQIALLSNEERKEQLSLVQDWARMKKAQATPIVFEGHTPASLSNCAPLREAATKPSSLAAQRTVATAWLGEPVAIKPPTSVQFGKQSGLNLLVVTRDEAEASGVLFAAALGLAIQPTPINMKFIDLGTLNADTGTPQSTVMELFPQRITVTRYQKDLQVIIPELADIVARRQNDRTVVGDQIFLMIFGIHRARDLRQEDGGGPRISALNKDTGTPNLSKLFSTILRDGPEVGVHVLAWADSYASIGRIVDRQSLREFGVRVVGAMSSQDSLHLIDDAAASKIDRPHRLIKSDESAIGTFETFRPYELPETEWLRKFVAAMPSQN